MWPSVQVAFCPALHVLAILLSESVSAASKIPSCLLTAPPRSHDSSFAGPACSAFPPKWTHYPVSARFHSNILVEKQKCPVTLFWRNSSSRPPQTSTPFCLLLSPRQTLGQSWNRNKPVMFFLRILPCFAIFQEQPHILGLHFKAFFPNFIWHLYVCCYSRHSFYLIQFWSVPFSSLLGTG